MLDEVDKIGMDFRGDPSSALLEVLDPEQNNTFQDNYLEVPFDLSKVLFVATANLLDPIPPALRDRMEIVQLPGYTEQEKIGIGKRFLVPKQMTNHGLKPKHIEITDEAMTELVRSYTHEAGVRNLERELANVMRKVARQVAEGRKRKTVIDPKKLADLLGPQRYEYGELESEDQTGAATGLVVTEVGGDVVAIEVTRMEGREDFILTGQLGEVMRESARAGLSWTRAHAQELGIPREIFEKNTLHIHVPAGAIPKDGPSAGITMATAIVSALTGIPVRKDVAMTGEITLRGRVLPIGGLKSKILAAHLSGAKIVILPRKNEKDLRDIPDEIRKSIKLILVDSMDQVLEAALRRKPKALAPEPPKVVTGTTTRSIRSPSRRRGSAGRTSRRPISPRSSCGEPKEPVGGRGTSGPVADGRQRTRHARDGVQGLLRRPRRSEDGVAGRDQEGLPQAGPPASPGRQARRQRRRTALQGGQRGQRGPRRSGQAQAVRRARRELGGRQSSPGGRRRCGRRPVHGLSADLAATSATNSAPTGEPGEFSDFFRVFFGEDADGGPTGAAGPRRGTRPTGGPGFDEILAGMGLGSHGSGSATGRPATGRTRHRPSPPAEAQADISLVEAYHGTTRLLDVDGKRLEITIPPGADTGTRIRLTGKAPGGGDLFVVARLLPDARFTRRGADLERDLQLTLEEALLGADVKVETLKGSVLLKIPAGTQSGRTFRLSGQGMPRFRASGHGDLYARAKVILPTNLTAEAKAAAVSFFDLAMQPDPR